MAVKVWERITPRFSGAIERLDMVSGIGVSMAAAEDGDDTEDGDDETENDVCMEDEELEDGRAASEETVSGGLSNWYDSQKVSIPASGKVSASEKRAACSNIFSGFVFCRSKNSKKLQTGRAMIFFHFHSDRL